MQKYSIRHDKSDRKASILNDGKFAVGVGLGLVLAVSSIVILPYVFDDLPFQELQSSFPVLVSLFVSLSSIFLAARAVSEQQRTREAATDPVLIAHLGQREDARSLVTFCITNVGAGAALNSVIEVQEPSGGIGERNLIINVFEPHRPFTVILQGETIEFNLAVGWELLGDHPLPPFKVKLTYEDLSGGEYESEYEIDVRQIEKMGAHASPTMLIAKALQKIEKKL